MSRVAILLLKRYLVRGMTIHQANYLCLLYCSITVFVFFN